MRREEWRDRRDHHRDSGGRFQETPEHLQDWDTKRTYIHGMIYHGIEDMDDEVRMYSGFLLEDVVRLTFIEPIHLDRIYELTEICLDSYAVTTGMCLSTYMKPVSENAKAKFKYCMKKYKIALAPQDMRFMQYHEAFEKVKLLHELKCRMWVDLQIVNDPAIVRWMYENKFISKEMLESWFGQRRGRQGHLIGPRKLLRQQGYPTQPASIPAVQPVSLPTIVIN